MRDLIDSYIIGVPSALMIIFTYDSIRFNGLWIVDMTHYGEYYIEVIMELFWFILIVYKIITMEIKYAENK
jgi:hypothetical protein